MREIIEIWYNDSKTILSSDKIFHYSAHAQYSLYGFQLNLSVCILYANTYSTRLTIKVRRIVTDVNTAYHYQNGRTQADVTINLHPDKLLSRINW